MTTTYLMTRKINGEEYEFYHMDFTKEESWTDRAYGCFYVKTPDNCLGYSNRIFFSNDKKGGHGIDRPVAPYIIKKLRGYLERRGYDPASEKYMTF